MSLGDALDLVEVFPRLKDDEREQLEEQLREGSEWSMNFGVMLGCSVLLAGLGLLQDSVAVVIGAMLVAPLMTPLVAIGLALVQGNFELLKRASSSMWRGVVVGLVLGFLLRVIIPGSELTQQVASRGSANILDLFIAFFAGVAAAYALARPKVSGALPGVAIAVALVPPLTASGIALGSQDWMVAAGAFVLLLTNVVMIVLGSVMVFRLHGLKTKDLDQRVAVSMKRIIVSLMLLGVLGMAPLAHRLIDQVRIGQSKPASYPLSEVLWAAVYERIEQEKGVELLRALRAGSTRSLDVKVFLLADRPVRETLVEDLEKMVKEQMGEKATLTVKATQSAPIIPATREPRAMPGVRE